MSRPCRPTNLIVIITLCLFIFSCSQLGIQPRKDKEESLPVPECKRNYTAEGVWPFNRLYKTWVRYDRLDYKHGFDAAVMTVKTSGYRTISTDRDSGTINAEIVSIIEDDKTYPIEIKLVREKSALTVHLSSPSAGGEAGKERLCRFYTDFEKSMKRSQPSVVAKQPPPSIKKSVEKPVEPERDSSPPPPPAPTVETPKASAPPVSSQRELPKTRVVWAIVNLREGPGTNYKVVGKVVKGTSLAILEEKGGWLFVRLESGQEAWISKIATSEGVRAQPASEPSPPRTSSPSPPPSSVPSPAAQSRTPQSPM
ncbi:MAG: SH3 domain-containing protein [Thermodesulfobacteriota bacterium]